MKIFTSTMSKTLPASSCLPLRRRRSTDRLGSVTCLLPTLAVLLLAGCATHRDRRPGIDPARVHARIRALLPIAATDRDGWATDITAAFAAQELPPTDSNLCATLAVIGQESTFKADPIVPGLGRIARAEIDRRAAAHHIPQWLVRGALALHSPDGRSYAERIETVRTEREMSQLYEDFIGMVPLGQRLFGGANPVHTGGPMQVSVDFAEAYARSHAYPYPVDHSIRHEVFSRRGGVYFGIAHLLDYPATYDRPLYRFADYNAGFYASRNAAFQQAVTRASGIPLALDGDLVSYAGGTSHTEVAVRSLSARLGLSDAHIHRALETGEQADFSRTELYRAVFALADGMTKRPLPRAILPRIRLDSPKITRKLTTAWFARRVDERYRRCMQRAGGSH